ncbi:YciI family protein [Sulfurospirillum arcachonense]|uniref:YciI family protein n=1 Tax=Sulfurospirillum arcachonense TaxID=57666 RepID=UPI00046ADD45|nr:YciI family protein [Sulfurospirillum arcachonense]
MFIVSLTYICDLKEVDKILAEHVEYLKNQYEQGNFIASGRKIPRTGGIILSKLSSLEKLEKILNQDPFKINNLAKYEIQEFIPSMTSKEFSNLKEE